MPWRAAIAGLIALAAAGCVVTDEIEFQADVNYPPEVLGTQPDTSSVVYVCREAQEFEVSLWEPDEEDAPPRTEAAIGVWLDANVSSEEQVAGDCTVSARSPDEGSAYEGGVLLTATCTMETLADASSGAISDGDMLIARVLVSDRPFVEGVPPPAARTAEVYWTLVVLPAAACGE